MSKDKHMKITLLMGESDNYDTLQVKLAKRLLWGG